MNERIKELADQAWHYADLNSSDGDGRHGHLYRDKFAELIIRDCAAYFRDAEGTAHGLEEHFGIKE